MQEGETISFLFKTDYDTYGDDPGEGEATPGGGAVAIGKYAGTCVIELFEFTAEVANSCPASATLCGPVATVIRQNNTAFPVDSCLMVSRMRTNVNLPTAATFEGQAVSFGWGVTRGGGLEVLYPYGTEEGEVIEGANTIAAYRMRVTRCVWTKAPVDILTT